MAENIQFIKIKLCAPHAPRYFIRCNHPSYLHTDHQIAGCFFSLFFTHFFQFVHRKKMEIIHTNFSVIREINNERQAKCSS